MKLPTVPPSDENVLPPVPRVPLPAKAKVLAYHLAGDSNRKIAKTLGMSKDTVGKILREGQMGPHAKGSVEHALERAGLTTDALLAHAKQGLTATETKLASFEGKFTDEWEVADNSTRFRYFEAAAKMLGMFPKEDSGATAQFFVRLPHIELTPAHGNCCLCPDCRRAWESLPIETVEP